MATTLWLKGKYPAPPPPTISIIKAEKICALFSATTSSFSVHAPRQTVYNIWTMHLYFSLCVNSLKWKSESRLYGQTIEVNVQHNSTDLLTEKKQQLESQIYKLLNGRLQMHTDYHSSCHTINEMLTYS